MIVNILGSDWFIYGTLGTVLAIILVFVAIGIYDLRRPREIPMTYIFLGEPKKETALYDHEKDGL